MSQKPTHQFFAPCPRGLETPLAQELSELGAGGIKAVDGGVHFNGDWLTGAKANLWSRLASRILWRVADGQYRSEQDIYKLARDTEWHWLFKVTHTLRINVSAHKSPLRSLEFVTLKIKDAVCDRFRDECGERPNIDKNNPDVSIHCFLDMSRCSIYLDFSGEPLFKRGWRMATNEAPLRENLAAGILRLAGWAPGTPLYDPMCGSGTFLVEAAMMALNVAPGLNRHFAFEKLNTFNKAKWQALLNEAQAARKPVEPLPIWGSDKFGDALKAARTNLAENGLADCIQLKQMDVVDASAPAETGVMVCNPPYGVRLDEEERLAALYPLLGDVLKRHFAGWNCYFLTGDPRLAKLIRLSTTKRTVLFNGALECRLFEYKMRAGSNRKDQVAE
ncbi:putative N6-adenine-specific DNA methylase [Chitinivorax tropicus]|uniref:Putative N6-adenine-specific DNA methylase n=1 Tax=Chitinivorax tropicus TaxID=714531 RepID=A0A840MT28_9PROT|nr:THUMP domain-containing protein [Chitinivorax tropicus]MBB5020239.1 putative N6-adenine-specific DNA methylase [Chitinivorax tropicus]